MFLKNKMKNVKEFIVNFIKNNSNYRVIRKYNITVFITLIRANQLITEFKAGSSSLSEAKKIEDYNLIKYIKVIDFQTMNLNQDFNLKTTN